MEEIQKNDTFQEPVSDNSAEVSQSKEEIGRASRRERV